MSKSVDDKNSDHTLRRNSSSILRRSKTLSIPRPRLKRQKNIHFEQRPPLLVISSSQSSINKEIIPDNYDKDKFIDSKFLKRTSKTIEANFEKRYKRMINCFTCLRPQEVPQMIFETGTDRNNSLSQSENEISSFEDNISQSFESCHLLNVPSTASLVVDTKNRRTSYGNKIQFPTIEEIQACRALSKKITLNVGGTIFQTLWQTLCYLPNTRLGRLQRCESHFDLMELCDGYDLEKAEFYFDRNSTSFGCILDFYRTGILHMSEITCVLTFSEDLKYWGINDVFIYTCCLGKYYHKKELMLEEMRKEEHALQNKDNIEIFANTTVGQLRKTLWDVLDKPNTSKLAKVIGLNSEMILIIYDNQLTVLLENKARSY